MSQQRQAKKSGLSHRLIIELLEDRTMLAGDVAAFNEFLQADLDAMDSSAYVESSASDVQFSSFALNFGPVDCDSPVDTSAPIIATDSGESTTDVVLPFKAFDSFWRLPADIGSAGGSPSPVPPVGIVLPGDAIGDCPELPLEIAPVVINQDLPVITIEKPTGISPVHWGLGPVLQPATVTQPVEVVSAPVHSAPAESVPSVVANNVYPAAVLVNYDPATQVATYDYYTAADAPRDRRTTVVDGYNVYRLSSLLNAGYHSQLAGDDAQAQALNARRDSNEWAQYFGVSINAHAGSEALGLYDPGKLAQELASYAGYSPAERALLEMSTKSSIDNLRNAENLIAIFERRIYEAATRFAELGAFKNTIGFEAIFAAFDRLISRMNSLTDYQLPAGTGLPGGTFSNGTTRVAIPMSDWLTMLKTREFATTRVMLDLNLLETSMPTLALQAFQMNTIGLKGPFENLPVSPVFRILEAIGMTIGEANLKQADAIPHFWDFIVQFFDTRVAETESGLQQQFAFMTGSVQVDGVASLLGMDSTRASTLSEQNDAMFALLAQSGTSGTTNDDGDRTSLATLVTQYNVDDPS
ncbi:MAG: hypothetical protein JNM18_13610 [Planctomycetaceae bacterium]|nr:hypothetical protein [Planctomycetaceae bacterium]